MKTNDHIDPPQCWELFPDFQQHSSLQTTKTRKSKSLWTVSKPLTYAWTQRKREFREKAPVLRKTSWPASIGSTGGGGCLLSEGWWISEFFSREASGWRISRCSPFIRNPLQNSAGTGRERSVWAETQSWQRWQNVFQQSFGCTEAGWRLMRNHYRDKNLLVTKREKITLLW